MTIRTQSADGMIHEFPDGTADAVIDKAMKAYAQRKSAPKPPALPFEKLSFEDKPGQYRGTFAPILTSPGEKRRVERGESTTEPAFPQIIAQPVRALEQGVRGAASIGQKMMGKRPLEMENIEKGLTDDELSALLTAGGAGVGSGMKAITPRVVPKPSTIAEVARSKGYVMPPQMAGKGGLVTKALSGLGGKLKLQQDASVKNQPVTNRLAAIDLGLPEDTVLTDKVFTDLRKRAGDRYEGVALALPEVAADSTYKTTIQDLGKTGRTAAQYFPELMENKSIDLLRDVLSKVERFPPRAGLELVKQLRGDAVQNLKAIGDPARHALGLAQRQAAEAVDALMERNVRQAGGGDLVKNYREARKLIAKSYDVESATNTATGDVSARVLARLSDKRPLSDQIKNIADTSSAFRKSMQDVATFGGPEAFSIFDVGAALASGAAGHPEILGLLFGRPLARKLLLSKLYQNRLIGPKAQSLPASRRAAPFLGAVGGAEASPESAE